MNSLIKKLKANGSNMECLNIKEESNPSSDYDPSDFDKSFKRMTTKRSKDTGSKSKRSTPGRKHFKMPLKMDKNLRLSIENLES